MSRHACVTMQVCQAHGSLFGVTSKVLAEQDWVADRSDSCYRDVQQTLMCYLHIFLTGHRHADPRCLSCSQQACLHYHASTTSPLVLLWCDK